MKELDRQLWPEIAWMKKEGKPVLVKDIDRHWQQIDWLPVVVAFSKQRQHML